MSDMNSMMSLFMVFIGLFTLYAAFTGKGPVFNNDYPRAMKADATQMLRKFCWYIGPVATVTGGLDYFWGKLIGTVAADAANTELVNRAAEVAQNTPFVWAQFPFLLSMLLIVPALVIYTVKFRKRFKEFLKKS